MQTFDIDAIVNELARRATEAVNPNDPKWRIHALEDGICSMLNMDRYEDRKRVVDAMLAGRAPDLVATEAVAQEEVCDEEYCENVDCCPRCALVDDANLLDANDDRNEAVAQGGGVDVEKVMALVERYGRCSSMAGQHHAYDSHASAAAEYDAAERALSEIRALLASPAPVGGMDYHAVSQFLYGLLDDIETASDIAKSDDRAYRALIERIQARKREVVAECDGYTVTFKAPAIAKQSEVDRG